MSDSINVRISLGHFDYAHPADKQTQVYVQLPEVARASWLLPTSMHAALAELPWEDALDSVFAHFEGRFVVADSTTSAARKTVHEWLTVDENRDAMNAAWFMDAARRHPVSRSLLADVERLKAENAALLDERHTTNEALDDAVQALREPLKVFRAAHDSIVMGLYTTAAEARKHCEAEERRSWLAGTNLAFDWIKDVEDDVAELVVVAGQNEESTTGYVVEALEVSASYDEEADE